MYILHICKYIKVRDRKGTFGRLRPETSKIEGYPSPKSRNLSQRPDCTMDGRAMFTFCSLQDLYKLV